MSTGRPQFQDVPCVCDGIHIPAFTSYKLQFRLVVTKLDSAYQTWMRSSLIGKSSSGALALGTKNVLDTGGRSAITIESPRPSVHKLCIRT